MRPGISHLQLFVANPISIQLASKEKLPFLTSEDLLERAARHWSQHLASQLPAAQNLKPGQSKPKVQDADSWKDIIDFGNTDACLKAMIKACDTQGQFMPRSKCGLRLLIAQTSYLQHAEVSTDVHVFRLSKDKVLRELERKVDLLSATSEHFDTAPETLGRKYNRVLESYPRAPDGPLLSDEGFEESQKWRARRKVAVEQVLAGWLSPAWVDAVKAHCNVDE